MNKRQRGRNRKQNNNSNNNNPNRSLDSNGPDVKIRGSASTIYDKYTALARDASSGGSRVKAESYLQHAEHYLRVMNEQAAKAAAIQAEKQAQHQRRQQQQQENAKSDDNISAEEAEGEAPKSEKPKSRRNPRREKADQKAGQWRRQA